MSPLYLFIRATLPWMTGGRKRAFKFAHAAWSRKARLLVILMDSVRRVFLVSLRARSGLVMGYTGRGVFRKTMRGSIGVDCQILGLCSESKSLWGSWLWRQSLT